MTLVPDSIRAITCDCDGTLIDCETGIREYVSPLLARVTPAGADRPIVTPDAWVARWERIQFQMLTPYRPYHEILARSFGATMHHFGLEAFVDDAPGFVRSVAEWRPFPDTTPALRRLARRFQLAIISNIDRDLLAATVGHLSAPFASLVTAEDARAYKPSPAPFQLALERLALPAAAILHAAFGWRYDLAPARAVGMRTAYVNRSGGAAPDGEAPDLEVPSLAALADALGA